MKDSKELEKAYQKFLDHVYLGMVFDDAFTAQELNSLKQQHVCHGYGELLSPSVFKMLARLNLTEKDTFVDLGSGMGKLALMAYLRTPAQIIGVEVSERLYQKSQYIYQQLQQGDYGFRKDLHALRFYHQNFLEFDFNQATVIYSCSTCYTQELLWLICEKINRAPNVRQVISLKPLDGLNMPFHKVFSVECSWDSALCYHYAYP